MFVTDFVIKKKNYIIFSDLSKDSITEDQIVSAEKKEPDLLCVSDFHPYYVCGKI